MDPRETFRAARRRQGRVKGEKPGVARLLLEAQLAADLGVVRRADEIERLVAGAAGIRIDGGEVDPVPLRPREIDDHVAKASLGARVHR